MATVGVDDSSLQVDSQPKSLGFLWGAAATTALFYTVLTTVRCSVSSMQQHEWYSTCDRAIMSLQRCWSYTGFRSLKGSTSNYVCLFTKHLLGMHHSTLQTLSGQWLICHCEPRCGQHLVVICMCHEHVEGSETERSLLWPHACGIVYLLTSNSTGRRQHLSNAVLKLFYLTGALPNKCKWLCIALTVF